ncbi:hypothetical protein [Mycobacterium sp. 852002-51057_SCH5723018]|uniref:hypothetical protein n=1 Tax=Mycobacterium sp. 852002-51057_SCH5723018 TaxID=1834094 RepID=UPI0007FC488E|nr:hypothetical protein [Mycobacterium sp. 852002-51057_SCH5723018]OBG29652.1 hypothetical protein A5764_22015 [Mycobacterium sp. 852002-51057_SCH5723018]
MKSMPLVVSTLFGALMVGLAAVGTHGMAVGAWVAALIAVSAGVVYRPAVTAAVLLCVATISVSDPSLVFAAWSGLCAAAYLVCRHAVGTPEGVVLWSWPTVLGAVGFTVAGLVATSFPLQLPWLPLAAPLAALAIYIVAMRPFVR